MQREIVNEQKDEPNIIGAALLFKIPGIILGLIIAWIWSMWIDDSRLSACILIFSGLIIARSLTFFSSSFIAKDKYLIFTLIGICTYVLFFFIKMFVLYYVPSLFYIAIVTVTENLFLIVLYYIYGCDKVSFTNKLVKKYIKVFYYEGFYLILSGAMVVIYTKTDQLYIAKFMSYTILANYAIALKFLMLYIVPSSIFTLSFVPKLNKNNKEYAKNVRVMLLGSLIFGVAFACICAMTTPFLIELMYGEKYNLAESYIIGLSLVIPFCFILNSTGRYFVNEGLGKIVFQRNLIALLYNIIGGYFLIKYGGAWGGVVAIVSSYAISALIVVFCGRKSRKVLLRAFIENENK
ncbi:Polysaccharide biosynthesis protein [Escherichia coli]|nr:Polysaccharide biosynthesis protein [Escherichia coli]